MPYRYEHIARPFVRDELGKLPDVMPRLRLAGVPASNPVVRALAPAPLAAEIARDVDRREPRSEGCARAVARTLAHVHVRARLASAVYMIALHDRQYLRYVHKRIRRREVAADIVLDSALAAYRRVRYSNVRIDHIQGYLYGIVRHMVADECGTPTPSPLNEDLLADIAEDVDTASPLADDVLGHLDELTPGERRAVDHYKSGKPEQPDGMTNAAYRKRLSSGFCRLRLHAADKLTQELLLDTLASTAATRMMALADAAWRSTTPEGLAAWLAKRDPGNAQDRRAARRLRAIAARVGDRRATQLIDEFLRG